MPSASIHPSIIHLPWRGGYSTSRNGDEETKRSFLSTEDDDGDGDD